MSFESALGSAQESSQSPAEPAKKKALPKSKETSLKKTLLLAGALHAGLGVAAYEGPAVIDAGEKVVARVQHKVETALETRRINQERQQMLREAREAQAEHRPWAGHFMIHSWFVEKRAGHEMYYDERQIQETYDRMLTQLRVKLHGEVISANTIQRALSEVLTGYDYWGGAGEAHMVDFLREHGGNCESVGPLIASLLEDLSVPGVGLRILSGNPNDEVPSGHIEATLQVRTGQEVATYGLQRGRRMADNGVSVRAADLLSYYQPGSTHLNLPVPRTEAERRPDPAGNRTIVPFQRNSVAMTAQETAATAPTDELSPERIEQLIAGRAQLVSTALEYITNANPPRLVLGKVIEEVPSATQAPTNVIQGYAQEDWERVSRLTQNLIQTAHAIRQRPGPDQAVQLGTVYATLGELHEMLRLQAAGSLRNAAGRRFEAERDRFFARSDEYLSQDIDPFSDEPEAEEVEAILNSTRHVREVYLQRATRLLSQPSISIAQRQTAVTQLLRLAEYAREADLQKTVIQTLEQNAQDPFNKAVIVEAIPRIDTQARGDHPFISQAQQIAEFATNGTWSNVIERSNSKTEFEQSLAASFRTAHPGTSYDSAYAISSLYTSAEQLSDSIARDNRQGELRRQGDQTALRTLFQSAEQTLRLLHWYEQDARLPSDYIANKIQFIQSWVISVQGEMASGNSADQTVYTLNGRPVGFRDPSNPSSGIVYGRAGTTIIGPRPR